MSILNTCKEKLKDKNLDKNFRQIIKLVIGEIQRSDNKNPTDDEQINIIKKIIKNCERTLQYKNDIETQKLKEFCQSFIENDTISNKEINNFLNTLDFSKFKNKKQAIGITIKHFKGNVNPKIVEKIIEEKY